MMKSSYMTYNFSSCANDSRGDNVPEVKMIEPTHILANSTIAIPGLKHHQLSVLEALPTSNNKDNYNQSNQTINLATFFSSIKSFLRTLT